MNTSVNKKSAFQEARLNYTAAMLLCMVTMMFFAATGCGKHEASSPTEDEVEYNFPTEDEVESDSPTGDEVESDSPTEDEVEYDFYYTGVGEKEIFTIRKDKVIIKTDSEADAKALIENEIFQFAYTVGYTWVLATIDPKKTTLDDLLKIEGVVDATYGLEYVDGSFAYPKNQIALICKEDQPLETVLEFVGLTKNVEVIELFNPNSGLYLITLYAKLGNILKISRDLYESGLCIVSPSFILQLKTHLLFDQ